MRYVPSAGLVFIFLSFAACGKSALTDQQRERFVAVLTSTGDVERAVPAPRPGLIPGGGVSSMTQSLQTAQCEIREDAGERRPGTRRHVGGAGCPIRLLHDVKFTIRHHAFDFAAEVDYRVVDPAYRRLNDVDEIALKGRISVNSGVRPAAANADLKGYVNSQREKAHVLLSVSGTTSQGAGEITLSAAFADFTAQLRRVSEGEQIHYYLNSEEIGEAKYRELVGLAGSALSGLSPVTPEQARIQRF
jgi:hypothetical protein